MTSEPRWQPPAEPPVNGTSPQVNGADPFTWRPFESFGVPPDAWDAAPDKDGVKWLHLSSRRPRGDSSRAPGSALINTAAVLLGLLAAGLFVVSLAAQYRYLIAERHQTIPSVIEAVGLDVGMAIFSLLALGLAMAGQSARVERALIVACALGSAGMNYAAANGGSPRSVAAYIMPPVFLAIVVDRVVAVVRRHVLGDADRSAWSGVGRVALYGLRFILAAPSTATDLRRQVLAMTPLPAAAEIEPPTAYIYPCPDCRSQVVLPDGSCASCGYSAEPEPWPEPGDSKASTPDPYGPAWPDRQRQHRADSKTSRFLDLVTERHGPLSAIDPSKVSRISSELAPLVDLHPGSARSVLGKRVRFAQNGHSS